MASPAAEGATSWAATAVAGAVWAGAMTAGACSWLSRGYSTQITRMARMAPTNSAPTYAPAEAEAIPVKLLEKIRLMVSAGLAGSFQARQAGVKIDGYQ